MHDPGDLEPIGFQICGHIHPCVHVEGKGRQRIRLACFWKSKHRLILPSLGRFTGMHRIKPEKGDEVFLIVKGEIVPRKV